MHVLLPHPFAPLPRHTPLQKHDRTLSGLLGKRPGGGGLTELAKEQHDALAHGVVHGAPADPLSRYFSTPQPSKGEVGGCRAGRRQRALLREGNNPAAALHLACVRRRVCPEVPRPPTACAQAQMELVTAAVGGEPRKTVSGLSSDDLAILQSLDAEASRAGEPGCARHSWAGLGGSVG